MSNTIAHRPHAHHRVALLPVFAVIVTVVVATAVIWAVNQPQPTTITTTTEAAGGTVVQTAAVAAPESPVFRHAQMRVTMNGGYPRAYLANQHHLVNGVTLDPASTKAGPGSTVRGYRLPAR